MSQQKVEVVQEFPLPVSQLFSYLSEHENLAAVFAPARVIRVCNGAINRNGVGSIRLIKIPLAPAIEETVTAFKEGELIEYRVSNKGLLKNHLGTMRFSPTSTGSRLNYTITFESIIPYSAPLVRAALEMVIRKGLKTVG